MNLLDKVRVINETDMKIFKNQLVQALLYIKELGKSRKASEYLYTMMRYVYSPQHDMSEADMKDVVKRLENTYPEGSEVVMTLAEIYKEKGKEEGREDTKLEIASNLLSLGLPMEQIVKATGLSEAEVEELRDR